MSLSGERPGGIESLDRVLRPPRRSRPALGFVVGVAGPIAVTALAAIPATEGTALPALLYVLTVIGSAIVGGLWPALVASGLSFAALDYYFTPPTRTFVVTKQEDLFALGVFLVVAVVASAAISAARERQARSEFRERQVRTLDAVTARLLSGSGLDEVVRDLAASIRTLYGLGGCRVLIVDATGQPRERALVGSMDGAVVTSIPLVADARNVGAIEMNGAPVSSVTGEEGKILSTFAGQLALAVERARLADEAAEARVQAAESRIRAALFSSITHDLRTPLASITASASSLLEEGVPFTPEQREDLLRTILEESDRLNRVVTNLLELSRIRAGALSPSIERVPIDDVVASVVRRLGPRLEGRTVRIQVREDLPPVPMDVVQMDQVLTNLLENAARYSPPGTEIGISAVRWGDAVEVKVSDRGTGIPPQERTKVFEEFYRRDVHGHRGGTGLGLAISQAMVLAHGGSMWIEESPGGGATVGFRLPLDPAPSRDRQADADAPKGSRPPSRSGGPS